MLNVKKLSKSFGENEVLKSIDLSVKEGEVVVIIGTFRKWEKYNSTLYESAGRTNFW